MCTLFNNDTQKIFPIRYNFLPHESNLSRIKYAVCMWLTFEMVCTYFYLCAFCSYCVDVFLSFGCTVYAYCSLLPFRVINVYRLQKIRGGYDKTLQGF